MKLADIEERFDELESLARGGGEADAATLRRIQGIIRWLRWDERVDPYAKGKLSEAAGWFDMLYSVRKHERHPGGASSLRSTILGALLVARRQPARTPAP